MRLARRKAMCTTLWARQSPAPCVVSPVVQTSLNSATAWRNTSIACSHSQRRAAIGATRSRNYALPSAGTVVKFSGGKVCGGLLHGFGGVLITPHYGGTTTWLDPANNAAIAGRMRLLGCQLTWISVPTGSSGQKFAFSDGRFWHVNCKLGASQTTFLARKAEFQTTDESYDFTSRFMPPSRPLLRNPYRHELRTNSCPAPHDQHHL
jgi:hypothetical protein